MHRSRALLFGMCMRWWGLEDGAGEDSGGVDGQASLDAKYDWLAKNITKKVDKSYIQTGGSILGSEKGPVGLATNTKLLPQSTKVVLPDTSRMVIYDPRQMKGPEFSGASGLNVPAPVAHVGSGNTKEVEDIFKMLSPAMMSFVTNLPAIEGPSLDVDVVLTVLLQSTLPIGHVSRSATSAPQVLAGPGPTTSDLSGPSKSVLNQNGSVHRPPRDGQSGKRKDLERQEEDDTIVQSRPLPRDIFRLRQIQRTRGVSISQTGSAASGGSAFSGEQSASTN